MGRARAPAPASPKAAFFYRYADVVEGAAAVFVGEAHGGQAVGVAVFGVALPPDAFGDESAALDAVGGLDGEVGLAALIAGSDGVAVLETAFGGVVWVDEECHDAIARELFAFVEGTVEDAHVGGVDEWEGLCVAVGREVVGQGWLAGWILDLDSLGGCLEVHLVVFGQRQVDGAAVSELLERVVAERQGPGSLCAGDELFDEFFFTLVEDGVSKVHGFCEQAGGLPVALALADGRDDGPGALNGVVAVGVVDVFALERGGGG